MTREEFLNSSPVELDLLLSEQMKYNSLLNLELANYIAALVMNEKAEENYKYIYKQITGEDLEASSEEEKQKTRKRIKMISTRLNLKCPYINENGEIVKKVI